MSDDDKDGNALVPVAQLATPLVRAEQQAAEALNELALLRARFEADMEASVVAARRDKARIADLVERTTRMARARPADLPGVARWIEEGLRIGLVGTAEERAALSQGGDSVEVRADLSTKQIDILSTEEAWTRLGFQLAAFVKELTPTTDPARYREALMSIARYWNRDPGSAVAALVHIERLAKAALEIK